MGGGRWEGGPVEGWMSAHTSSIWFCVSVRCEGVCCVSVGVGAGGWLRLEASGSA